MTRAALAMGNGFRGNAFASPRSAVCTWCPLNFGAAAGIFVVDFNTHFGEASVDERVFAGPEIRGQRGIPGG